MYMLMDIAYNIINSYNIKTLQKNFFSSISVQSTYASIIIYMVYDCVQAWQAGNIETN